MAEVPPGHVPKKIRFRSDDAEVWAAANPILKSAEPGYDEDARRFKIGDGVTHWNDLPFQMGSSGGGNPDGCEYEPDLPDFTLIFENGLI